MTTPWNLASAEWSDVLTSEVTVEAAAARMVRGEWDLAGPGSPAWTDTLLQATNESSRVLDLGSGRGENSAALARAGRRTTLMDWAHGNMAFGSSLFRAIGAKGQFCQADMTQPLPFKNDSFDLVFSCGVFEYFDEPQIEAILREAFRVSRGIVIIMVPNALSAAYRFGMWYLKMTGKWKWGGEVPSVTLKPRFRAAGFRRLREFSVASRQSLGFLVMPFGSFVRRLLLKVFGTRDSGRPSFLRQGYLLVTIGDKETAGQR